ncbi:MAG: hypothetical protein WCI75_17535, partial [candidate division NC10 bacterium]
MNRFRKTLKNIQCSLVCAFLFTLGVGVNSAQAQAFPGTMNFQGRLTGADNNPLGGPHLFTFNIYNMAAGGTSLWTETQTLTVVNGVMSAVLGSVTPLPYQIFTSSGLYLEITVDAVTLSPREPLVAVPYAFYAANASTATSLTAPAFFAGQAFNPPTTTPGAIYFNSTTNKLRLFTGLVFEDIMTGTSAIPDGAVTTPKLAADAVTTIAILNANVTTPKLAVDAVTNINILNGAVTTSKIAP